MFDGIKMLCMGAKGEKYSFQRCLQPMIVPEQKFLKVANTQFSCPSCGLQSNKIQPFFKSLIDLRKTSNSLKRSGIYIRFYELTIESCYEEGFDDLAPYLLENKDWTTWNMQISSITIASLDKPSSKMEIWEDHNSKAKPFYHSYQSPITFSKVLKRDSVSIGEKEIDITILKTVLKNIRNYNSSWRDLVDSDVTAAPVDLENTLYTTLAGVDSLDELFPEDERIK